MANHSLITSADSSRALKADELDTDILKYHIKRSHNIDCTEDSFSTCSTNIASKTQTLESLPAISDELDDTNVDNADDWQLMTNDISLEDHAVLSDLWSPGEHNPKTTLWTNHSLQDSMDRVFKTGAASLLDLSFPFAMADAELEGCPIIGCSTGFTGMSGHEMNHIVGFSCRFLMDTVPSWEHIDQETRRHCRDFCLAAKEGRKYRMPSQDLHADWLSEERPSNELIVVQANTHKEGWLFNSMSLMKIVSLGDFDDERNYIISLQSEVPGKRSDSVRLRQHLAQLDKNMAKVMKILEKEFITSGAMYRQYTDGDVSDESDVDL